MIFSTQRAQLSLVYCSTFSCSTLRPHQVHQIGEGDPQGQRGVCQLRLRREGPCARVVQKTAQGRLWEGRENEESEFLKRRHFRLMPFCGRVFASEAINL